MFVGLHLAPLFTPRRRKPAATASSVLLRVLTVLIAGSVAVVATGQQTSAAADAVLDRSQTAVDALQRWYSPTSGLYATTGWWNSANAITALANYSRVSGSREYLPVFANTLSAAQHLPDGSPGFVNKYYDDEGWWALAWIDVFDLTGETRYLQTARQVFENMQGGWETATCGGGVWWSKDNRDKNAIENELFLAVAASLANRDADAPMRARDLAWAQKEWEWFRSSGMLNHDSLINDGLNLSDPAHCTNNGKATWTYNQGVILGALIELNRAAPDPELLRTASAIADATIVHLPDARGILQEPNGAHSGADVPQFKGIFVRNLMLLNAVAPQPRYRSFIETNADALWERGRNSAGQFGFWWQGPVDQIDAARQSSGLDLLVAADSLRAPSIPNFAVATSGRGCRSSNIDVVYIGDSITFGVLLDHPDTESPPAAASDWIRQTVPGSAVFFSNQGYSGHTTVDFLPATGTDLPAAERAANTLLTLHPGLLIFSVMLGTNDSAEYGPNGSPVGPRAYAANLRLILAELLRQFSGAVIVLQQPIWYSPNTHNHSDYEQAGLDRLQSYFPAMDAMVQDFGQTNPGRVRLGDTEAFAHFASHYQTEINAETGVDGTFYLHPNAAGAKALGYYWASAIDQATRSDCHRR